MTNRLRNNIEYVGLDYKKEITKLAILSVSIIVLTIALFFILKKTYLLLGGGVVLAALNYLMLSSYSSRKKALIKNHSEEFVHIISYFRIFIVNRNNVYQSFNKLIDYSSDWMKEKIETFLLAIDGDKSIKPFTDFADKFDLPVARNVLVSIYQMVEQGETVTQLSQFTVLFEQMNRTINDEKKDKKMRSFDIITFFPIVGAGIVTLSLTFSMLSLVGDMVNVI